MTTEAPTLESCVDGQVEHSTTSASTSCIVEYTHDSGFCQDSEDLATLSPRDQPWDTHRCQAQGVESIYRTDSDFDKLAQRVSDCSRLLLFGRPIDKDTGEIGFALRRASFCRVRHCPVCQWRRSLMWRARFYQAIPTIAAEYPKARWLFLTLTVRNCEITELSETLKAMNAGWQRLKDRKEFAKVDGFIRTTEVTRGDDGSAHPHFHCLLMVPPSYFTGKSYVTHAQWVESWRQAMRLDYDPYIHVQTVKAKGEVASTQEYLARAVCETLKYSVKPDDMLADDGWLLELTRQLHRKRFIASGGALKDVLREADESDDDLIVEGDGEADDGARVAFTWRPVNKKYKRSPRHDTHS